MIQRYTWKHLDIDDYLLDCFNELESVKVVNLKQVLRGNIYHTLIFKTFQVQNFVHDYKFCNIEIVKICEEMANSILFQVDRVQILKLKELKKNIETIKYEYNVFIIKNN